MARSNLDPGRRGSPIEVLKMDATPEEIEKMLNLEKESFQSDPFIDLCFNRPGVPSQSMEAKVAKHLKQISNPQFMYHKAVYASDPDGPMVGASLWYLSPDPFAETVDSPMGPFPEGTHKECIDAALVPLRGWRHQYFRDLGKPYAHMVMLSVATAEQRRGIGTALLKEGLREVDARGLATYISASPAGLGLYKRFGWKEEFSTKINLADYGGEDFEVTTVALIRPCAAR